MNSTPERYESLSDAAKHALQDLRQATRQGLLEPLAEGTRGVAHKAQSGCHAMAQTTLHDVQRLECWAAERPFRSVALAFASGVLIGMVLFRR